jgi:hypothetical protein
MSAMKVVAMPGYDRRARKLFTRAERASAELEIALAPTEWLVIRGTGGARKARAARGGIASDCHKMPSRGRSASM